MEEQEARFFLLTSDDHARQFRPRKTISYAACGADGRYVSSYSREVCDNIGWNYIEDVSEATVVTERARPLANKLYARDEYHIIDESLREVVDSLRTSESIAYLPVRVLDERGELRANYWIAYAAREYNPIDKDKSTFTYWDNRPNTVRDITKWVFDLSRTPAQDLFLARIPPEHWICTGEFRDLVLSRGLTGCAFGQIWPNED